MSTLHECPCGCGARVARNRLACRAGWYSLPEVYRAAIGVALAGRNWGEHRKAVAAASTWLRERERSHVD